MFITYPDVDNLSACGVGACWQVQASAGRASPTGPCCTGAGRAALINVDGDVVGNGGASRSDSSATALVADGAIRPIRKIQPLVIA